MPYITKNTNGKLFVHELKPYRTTIGTWDSRNYCEISHSTFMLLTGKTHMDWDDEPIEIELVINN